MKTFEEKQNFLSLFILDLIFSFVSFFSTLRQIPATQKSKNVPCQIVFNLPLTASKKLKKGKVERGGR